MLVIADNRRINAETQSHRVIFALIDKLCDLENVYVLSLGLFWRRKPLYCIKIIPYTYITLSAVKTLAF